jgi:hypothetical protein
VPVASVAIELAPRTDLGDPKQVDRLQDVSQRFRITQDVDRPD